MGNRQVTQANSVDGKRQERSCKVVVPPGANEQVDVLVHQDLKDAEISGPESRPQLTQPPDKVDKRKKRFGRQGKAAQMVRNKQQHGYVTRQTSMPFLGSGGYGRGQAPHFYSQPMTPCYPPGAMWQQIAWAPAKVYPLPLDQRSMLMPSPYQPNPRWQYSIMPPPRSISLDNCQRGTGIYRVHAMQPTVDQQPKHQSERSDPMHPGRLFKFATGLRPHMADALPKCQEQASSASSARSVGADMQQEVVLQSDTDGRPQKAAMVNGCAKVADEVVVVRSDAQTVMERNAQLLAEAEGSAAVVPLRRYQSVAEFAICPSENEEAESQVANPVSARWQSRVPIGSKGPVSVNSVDQSDTRSAATTGNTPAGDVLSEIDFSWIADLESRLDHSSDQLSRARKSSLETSSISASTVGLQRDLIGVSESYWSKEDQGRQKYYGSSYKPFGVCNGDASFTEKNGLSSPMATQRTFDSADVPRRFVMWRPAQEDRMQVFIPEPDYD